MRGSDVRRDGLFSYVRPESRIPSDHPLRLIRKMANEALTALNRQFAALYSANGRPSIPPEQLLRALLLQAFYTIRSERQLMEQLHYNLLYREEEREMMKLCQTEGVGVIPWSPLARGRLARPWDEKSATKRGETDEYSKTLYAKSEEADRAVVDRVTELSRRRNIPQAQVALAWMLSKPYITAPIVGATKPNHITDAVTALSVKLSAEEIARLEEPYVPHAVVGFE